MIQHFISCALEILVSPRIHSVTHTEPMYARGADQRAAATLELSLVDKQDHCKEECDITINPSLVWYC